MILALLFQNNNNFIKNSEYPICQNCIYYEKNKLFPDDYLLAKCKLFGEQNVISGEVVNYYVDVPRKNEKLCGIKGKYYKKTPYTD